MTILRNIQFDRFQIAYYLLLFHSSYAKQFGSLTDFHWHSNILAFFHHYSILKIFPIIKTAPKALGVY